MKKVIYAVIAAGALSLASCGGSTNGTTVTKGSLSKFDTLSYAVGVDIAGMIATQHADLPVDFGTTSESFIAAITGKSDATIEEVTTTLQEYFTDKYEARITEVNAARDAADSVALANGADTLAVLKTRQNLAAEPTMFESEQERQTISSAMGTFFGQRVADANMPLQTVWLSQAFEDVLAGEPRLDAQDASAAIQNYFTVVIPAENLAASNEWLASIEKKSGVQKTASGLLYKIEVEGDTSVKATSPEDVVRVKYTGKTREGKVFDSSLYEDMSEDRRNYLLSTSENGELPEDGEIVEFPLNRVIPGWTEGMQLVGKGGRISLWIPSELAYGQRAASADIQANSALYFDVELIDVNPVAEAE